MPRNAQTNEYETDLKLGQWVRAVEGGSDFPGILLAFDKEDGEFSVFMPNLSAEEQWGAYDGGSRTDWFDHESVSALPTNEIPDTPILSNGRAGHAFVIDWIADGVPNVDLLATPQGVTDYLAELFPDRDDLDTLPLHAIAEPGERIEVGGSDGPCSPYGLRFMEVC